MAVEARSRPREALADAAGRLAAGLALRDAFELIAAAAVEATGAELAIVRVLDPATGGLVGRAVAPPDSPLGAETAGSRVAAAPPERVVSLPVRVDGRVAGALELVAPPGGLTDAGRAFADLAAAQLALTLRQVPEPGLRGPGAADPVAALDGAGEALAAGAALAQAADHAVRVAADATGAVAAAIWRLGDDGLEPLAVAGEPPLDGWRALALAALDVPPPLTAGAGLVSIQLGQPPFGVLQLAYADLPSAAELEALSSFAVRTAHALRAGARARDLETELDRTRAVLSAVGEAISRLSLAHALETALERAAELLSVDRVGIYLRDGGQLVPAAGRGLTAGHEEVAWRLLELALGPLRARGTIELRPGGPEPVPPATRRALATIGAEAALAIPLRVHDEPIGLLVAYPGAHRLDESERTLLAALAAQLAVAVQNARLHEQTKELGDALAVALESERQAARQLVALYEISRSFAQTLSLEATLRAVATTVVAVLDVDAAVIRMSDERGESMVARAVHVADERLAAPVRAVLDMPQPRDRTPGSPTHLDAAAAARLGGAHALLVPFLRGGSTAAVLPISTPAEPLAELTIVSLAAERPISRETVAAATTIAAQAALAIDNARLYQQQKAFAETIQRALLPRTRPRVPGLELGAVYESAARVDVGGDVYDFVELGGGRIAVVLGDVTGHGIDATADMAMAKFVFRSLVRQHPEPGAFLARANDVIAEDIAPGKFITMAVLAIGGDGAVACASAGHPSPRILFPDGRVDSLECGGLALGIDPGQRYDEGRAELPSGAAVVLYTDGVVEARRGRELYGVERLDVLLAARRDDGAQTLAAAVLADCQAFAGGELADDGAVVVVKVA
jgi:serine phosphatase RsbU (regulator of sigma subunit)